MPNRATVTAADIARLAGVGRAAVSNWRRRHDDFPKPIGGTASSPTFSLSDVEEWLRAQGKLAGSPMGERVWQALRRAAADEIELSDALAYTGGFLLLLLHDEKRWKALRALSDAEVAEALPEAVRGHTEFYPPRLEPSHVPVVRAVADLAGELGVCATFDFLRTRYFEQHIRRGYVTPEPVARLMLELAGPVTGAVLDPACGSGAFLSAALGMLPGHGGPLLGQDADEATARLTAITMALRTDRADIRAGDSLRTDAFPGVEADLVICNPPFNDRNWGYDELIADPRWEYGLPPRMEPELAWVQHALAHTRPGGTAVLLMPPAAADRRSGRRIRAEFLRRGALRAIVGLPLGAVPNTAVALSLWVLARPVSGARSPDDLLMVDTAGFADFAEAALRSWTGFTAGADAAPGARVRIIDLLDDEVDLTPGRYVSQGPIPDASAAFTAARDRLMRAAADLTARTSALAALVPAKPHGDMPTMTMGDLAKTGVLSIASGPSVMPAADRFPALTLDDLRADREPVLPTGAASTGSVEPAIPLAAGDLVVSMLTRYPETTVVSAPGAVLGLNRFLIRVDPERCDAHFLAGRLEHAVPQLNRFRAARSAPCPRSEAVQSGPECGQW